MPVARNAQHRPSPSPSYPLPCTMSFPSKAFLNFVPEKAARRRAGFDTLLRRTLQDPHNKVSKRLQRGCGCRDPAEGLAECGNSAPGRWSGSRTPRNIVSKGLAVTRFSWARQQVARDAFRIGHSGLDDDGHGAFRAPFHGRPPAGSPGLQLRSTPSRFLGRNIVSKPKAGARIFGFRRASMAARRSWRTLPRQGRASAQRRRGAAH